MMISIIATFLFGACVTLSIVNIINERRYKRDEQEFEALKTRHNMLVNKMFDDIDRDVEEKLRKERRESEYLVDPLPLLRSMKEDKE